VRGLHQHSGNAETADDTGVKLEKFFSIHDANVCSYNICTNIQFDIFV
jgi:hypothetical protein